jgi:hypothetical protein
MGKLFLIIYAGSQIGGAAGPLPYGMDECEKRRDELRAARIEVLATGFSKAQNRALSDVEMAALKVMRFECEYYNGRPTVEA